MARPRRTRQEWRDHTAAWSRSGLTAADYAKRHGLNPGTFSWWRTELRRERSVSPGLTLVPVTMAPARAAHVIEVALTAGVGVRVSEQSALARVAPLVRGRVSPCIRFAVMWSGGSLST